MKNSTDFLGALEPEVMERMTTRREALRTAGRYGLGAALASTPLALAGMARNAFGQSMPSSVAEILNFALTLEYLEAEYYTQGLAAAGLIPAADRGIFDTIRAHEQTHVDFLRQQLGSAAVAKPAFDFTAGGAFAPFQDYAQFKLLAQAFEDTGVRAYKGQAPKLIDNDTVLQAALTIHSVEARHAARVRQLNGLQGWIPLAQPGTPAAAQPVYQGEEQTTQLNINVASLANLSAETTSEAFDEPLTMEQVLAVAKLFIRS